MLAYFLEIKILESSTRCRTVRSFSLIQLVENANALRENVVERSQ